MNDEACEICGKPADVLVNDFFSWVDHDTDWWEHAVAKDHAFCDEHKRESIEIDVSMQEGAWNKMKELGLDPKRFLAYYRADKYYSQMDIGIYTIVFNGYGQFLSQWCKAISELKTKPKKVLIALFGEDHGLPREDKVECYNLLKGIDFSIRSVGEHTTIGADRNAAVKLLNTEWVMLVSADDIILPDAINTIERRDKPSADVIACPYIERLMSGHERVISVPEDLSKDAMLNWRKTWFPPYSPFRKSFWEQHPYEPIEYPNIPFGFSFAAYDAQITRAKDPCVMYIKRPDSHYGKRKQEEQAEIEKALDGYQAKYSEIRAEKPTEEDIGDIVPNEAEMSSVEWEG